MRRLFLAALIAMTLAPAGLAQQRPQPIFRASTQLIVTTVSVTDRNGRPIERLTVNDFIVTEDNEPQDIAFIQYQRLDDLVALPALAFVQGGGVAPAPDLLSLVQPGITAPPAGDERFRNRRLIILFFDLSEPPGPDQERMFTGALTYLGEQMTAADLVAIMTYRGGAVRVKQDFTDDTM
jgi:VWFA-related protein